KSRRCAWCEARRSCWMRLIPAFPSRRNGSRLRGECSSWNQRRIRCWPPSSRSWKRRAPDRLGKAVELIAALRGSNMPVAKLSTNSFRIAQTDLKSEPGVVMDYLIVNSPLLNINFNGGGPEKTGFAAIGQTANDIWNDYSFA